MFQPMRRSEKEISKERCNELLDTVEYGVLSINGIDGYPYGVPLNFSREEDVIYFHGALSGHKVKAIEQSPLVCLTVVAQCDVVPDKFDTMYESVVVFGRVERLESEEDRTKGFLSIIKKYSSDHLKEGKEYIEQTRKGAHAFHVKIDHMTGKLGR